MSVFFSFFVFHFPHLSSSPTLSPDISPLFPSSGGVPLGPSESSLLTISLSQSSPDLNVDVAPDQPDLAFAPSGSLLVSHAISVTPSLPINASAPPLVEPTVRVMPSFRLQVIRMAYARFSI
ncbi:hypothetical protein ACFX1X_028879 [Malus domestica]